MSFQRPLRMGMVGGGRGAFIGAVHRMAAQLDGKIVLTAGCFSSDPEKNRLSGEDLFLPASRVYADYADMARREAELPENERIDFVSIVTPNNTHVPIAIAFLEAGFDVVCEKPAGASLAEALQLQAVMQKTDRLFALMHSYTGYPLVREARARVQAGQLGRILKIVAEYPQDWLLPRENTPPHLAGWRTDPAIAGDSLSMGDIGSHAENLGRFITGLRIESLCADLRAVTPGCRVDDDGNVLIRYQGGARGILYASQVSAGEENALAIRIYGEKGALEWHQENPNHLLLKFPGKPTQVLTRGQPYLDGTAAARTRLPTGHPEGLIEAFANIYLDFAEALIARKTKTTPPPRLYPDIDDAVLGMAFIEGAIRSSRSEQKWTALPA